MSAILTELISLLVGGITGIATGIGEGLSNLVQSIFVNVDTASGDMSLTTFGGLVAVFAGISLAVGLSKYIVSWVSSLGASN